MNNSIPVIPLTVTQLNNQVNRSLHQQYRNINVIGEINNFKKYKSGHVYFILKDKSSEISCVMFSHYYEKLNIDIKDGNNLMLLPLDKIINAEKLDESVTEDEEDEEYTEDKTNVRESR